MVRNVLLVTIDSLRFDAASRLLEENDSTVATLSDEGVWFSRAYATGPGTNSSFPALLTGTYALSYDGLGPLSPDRPRVSEYFARAGFATGGFHCNPFLSTHFNYDIGFETFEDYQHPLMGVVTRIFPRGIELNNPTLQRVDDTLKITDVIKKSYRLLRGKPRPYVSSEVITDDTLSWLDQHDRFFCWTHYMDVHHPCFPPELYRQRFNVDDVTQADVSEWYSTFVRTPNNLTADELDRLERLYEAAIAYTDDQVGRIVSYLRETDRFDETLIILTSDHGELFGEHGQYGKPERLYDELLHVPLIVVNGPSSARAHDLVSLIDIPPLLHEATGLPVPDVYEGKYPGSNELREVILAEHERHGDVIVGGRSARWLYEHDTIQNEQRLVDVQDGAFEPVTIDSASEGAKQVIGIVRNQLREIDGGSEPQHIELNDDLEARLEELGYR